jgi:hypothetical protein
MKGSLHTDELMSAVVKRNTGLRTRGAPTAASSRPRASEKKM